MPKKLKVSSNERVDIEDFNRASTEYTEESGKFHRSNLWLSKYHGVLQGFRIELADQSASPGQFTIYNGMAIDRAGSLLNNEAQLVDARTVTLSGTNATFYVEIEFTQSDSDVDVRAFWDPTFASNDPAGKEFTQNVATRITPDWQVVTGTGGFDISSDVDSLLVPIAVLTTNGSGAIESVAEYYPRTTTVRNAAQTDTVLYVADSTLLSDSGAATLRDIDGSTTESVTVLTNDRVNGIITLASGITTVGGFAAGAILEDTSPSAEALIEESTDPRPTSLRDRRTRFFAGDEERGTGLAHSKYTAGDKDDLDISSLKDYVDFLSAQIHELKYGRMNGTADPSPVPVDISTSARYYDYAGSIAGSRSSTVTVGDGTTSRGDLISASSNLGATLQSAHSALPSTGGSIVIKAGAYTWGATTAAFTKPVRLVFEHGIDLTVPATGLMTSSADFTLENFPVPTLSGAIPVVFDCLTNSIEFRAYDSWLGRHAASFSNSTDSTFTNCTFESDDTNSSAVVTTGNCIFNNCKIRYNSTTSYSPTSGSVAPTKYLVRVASASDTVVFNNCTFDVAYDTGSCYGWVYAASAPGNLVFQDCVFTATNDSSDSFVSGVNIDTTTVRVAFERCSFFANYWDNPGVLVGEGYTIEPFEQSLIYCTVSTYLNSFRFSDCEIVEVENGFATRNFELTYLKVNIEASAYAGKIDIRDNELGFRYVDGTSEGTAFSGYAIYCEAPFSTSHTQGTCTVVNNTIHNMGGSAYVFGFKNGTIAGNTVFIENSGVSFPVQNRIAISADCAVLNITNNSISRYTEATSASSSSPLISANSLYDSAVVVVSGNTIRDTIGGASQGAGSSVAIRARSANTGTSGGQFTVSNNTILQRAVTLAIGIQVDNDFIDDAETPTNFTVSGNTIQQEHISSTASSADWRGIYLTQTADVWPDFNRTSIVGNTINQRFAAVTTACNPYGIEAVNAYGTVIRGNIINQLNEEAANSTYMYGIATNGGYSCTIADNQIDGRSDTPSQSSTTGPYTFSAGIAVVTDAYVSNINVSGNTVRGIDAYTACILIRAESGSNADLDNVKCNNNEIYWNCSSSYGGNYGSGILFYIATGSAATIKSFTICNNVITSDPDGPGPSADSFGICLSRPGTAVDAYLRGNITGNSVFWSPDSTYTSDGAGIYVKAFQDLVLSSNTVDAAFGCSIRVLEGDGLVLSGNSVSANGQSTVAADIYGNTVTNVTGSGNGTRDNSIVVSAISFGYTHGNGTTAGTTGFEANNRVNAIGAW